MAGTTEELKSRADAARSFLTRLWNLENDERPGFIIGDLGGEAIGGRKVTSALFSTNGADTVRDRLLDPEKFLNAQLTEMNDLLALRGDYVPTLCPALGVIGIPSAFGCEVVWWERDFPAVRPAIGENIDAVYDLQTPSVRDGELGRVLDYTKYFIEKTNASCAIRLADIQGPLDTAALVLGHTNFLLALRTDPAAAHHLLKKVTDFTIQFARAHRDLVRGMGAEFVPSLFQPWLPDGTSVAVSNDECAMISAELHDEFSLPYLNILAEEFGGIYVHSCGRWEHQIPSLRKVSRLRGLEFGASEAPFEPVIEQFNGSVVLAARIGLHRDLKFNGMTDFVRRLRSRARTNRGLFIHVDITNGIVGEDWPVTDLKEIYALLQ